MLPDDGHDDRDFLSLVCTLAGVVREYLSEARGSLADDFKDDTPFMDAGLDSLDMLKVTPTPRAIYCRAWAHT